MNSISHVECSTCSYCDLQEVDRLASVFLDKLCSASLIKHPRLISDIKVNTLKNGLIDTIFQGPTRRSTGSIEPTSSAVYSFEKLSRDLEDFVEEGKSALSMASSALSTGKQGEQSIRRSDRQFMQFIDSSATSTNCRDISLSGNQIYRSITSLLRRELPSRSYSSGSSISHTVGPSPPIHSGQY